MASLTSWHDCFETLLPSTHNPQDKHDSENICKNQLKNIRDKGRSKEFPCFFSPVWQQYFWLQKQKDATIKTSCLSVFVSCFQRWCTMFTPPKWWIVAIESIHIVILDLWKKMQAYTSPLNWRAPAKPKEEKSCADGPGVRFLSYSDLPSWENSKWPIN